jgi:hypothetical protein
MTISDGMILFAFCCLSFALGYAIGAIRVGRYVNKRLTEITTGMEQVLENSKQLRQIYAKLEGEEPRDD